MCVRPGPAQGPARDGGLQSVAVVPMTMTGSRDGVFRYEANCTFEESGTFGCGVRVRPDHANLPNPFALHLVKWATAAPET